MLTSYLLDTHTWAWTLVDSRRLSRAATATIREAIAVWVSPISVYEIIQKVRVGKWPEMEPVLDELIPALSWQQAAVARLDADICFRAASLDWVNRDPFDRMLVATALAYAIPIISADRTFDGVVTRIW